MKEITRRKALMGGGAMLPAAWCGGGTNVALAKSFEIPPAGDPDDHEFWRLARELMERCRDFARLEAVYQRNDGARNYYYDAYQGVIETAKCIHWSEQPGIHDNAIIDWVSSVYPDDIAWVLCRESHIHGLSERFAELNVAFEDALRGLAAWSAWPINPLHMAHRQWDATVKALRKFTQATDALRKCRASTPGDLSLKRRAIEHIHCGLGGKIAKAKFAYGFTDLPLRADLALVVEMNRARGFTQLRCRTNWREWQWIYS